RVLRSQRGCRRGGPRALAAAGRARRGRAGGVQRRLLRPPGAPGHPVPGCDGGPAAGRPGRPPPLLPPLRALDGGRERCGGAGGGRAAAPLTFACVVSLDYAGLLCPTPGCRPPTSTSPERARTT